jgi:hypothetical protein
VHTERIDFVDAPLDPDVWPSRRRVIPSFYSSILTEVLRCYERLS